MLYYNLMEPLSYMQSVTDRNAIMQCMIVLILKNLSVFMLFKKKSRDCGFALCAETVGLHCMQRL